MHEGLRFAFAGDRFVAVRILDYLTSRNEFPVALLVPAAGQATHDAALASRCPDLTDRCILRGKEFREEDGSALLARLQLDYLISVHFPYVVPPHILAVPRKGCVNLHPAFLPFNRGWHTPTWSILDGTPAGATLHFMDEGLDSGHIIQQREVAVRPEDTGTSLYQRILDAEVEVFREAWPRIVAGDSRAVRQDARWATTHGRQDLFDPSVQRLEWHEAQPIGQVIDRMRALTTNRVDEACYFERGGKRYRIRVEILPEGEGLDQART